MPCKIGSDLAGIWRSIKRENNEQTADRVEGVIREKFAYVADFPAR
jgi:hypothetical protein